MNIRGLENDYYLSYNDVWIILDGEDKEIELLELNLRNINASKALSFILYPSLFNDFEFNICLPIRALFPFPNHKENNSLQKFEISFTIKFGDSNIPNQTNVVEKYFVRGGREKSENKEWYLSPSEELVVGKWVEWGVKFPTYASRIQNDQIVNYIPNNPYLFRLRACNYKVVKFLNSLGGYQYYIFDSFEIKTKSKANKVISRIPKTLSDDNFLNIGNETEKTITLKSKTPLELQDVITDLISSIDVLLYNDSGAYSDANWQRLVLENNDSVENNFDRVYDNELKYSFSNEITRIL